MYNNLNVSVCVCVCVCVCDITLDFACVLYSDALIPVISIYREIIVLTWPIPILCQRFKSHLLI